MFSKKQFVTMFVVIVGSYIWLVNIKRGPVYESTKSLKGKTVLITGGNLGVGKATALLLAQRQAKVIIASRNIEKSKIVQKEIISETGNRNVKVLQLDLSNFDNVRKVAQEFIDNEKHLDYLINNAGANDLPGVLPSGVSKMFAVNHFGHFLLTNLLMEKMKEQSKTRPVRIINLSSESYKAGSMLMEDDSIYYNPNTTYELLLVYSATKLANVYFSRELHERLKDHDGSITAYTVHPGAITTGMGMNFWKPVQLLLKYVLWPLFFRSPFYGAQTTMYCALDDDVVDYSGSYFSNCQYNELYELGQNETLQKQIWKKSMEITGLKDEI